MFLCVISIRCVFVVFEFEGEHFGVGLGWLGSRFGVILQ